MEKEQKNDFRIGQTTVMRAEFQDDSSTKQVEYELINFIRENGDYIEYKNLDDEVKSLFNSQVKIKELWFSEDFYTKLGLKPCSYSCLILGIVMNSKYKVCNFFENDDYYFITVLVDNSIKKNYIFQKWFNVKWKPNTFNVNFTIQEAPEVFEILNKLCESKLWATYNSVDELFEILDDNFNKIEFLKKLNPEDQFNVVNRQPKYKLV